MGMGTEGGTGLGVSEDFYMGGTHTKMANKIIITSKGLSRLLSYAVTSRSEKCIMPFSLKQTH